MLNLEGCAEVLIGDLEAVRNRLIELDVHELGPLVVG